MAPADEAIAKARHERKKSMEQTAEIPAQDNCLQQGTTGGGFVSEPYLRPSLLEQLEESVNYHFEQYQKSQEGAHFLRAHPELAEFLRMMRAGIFPLAIVFALCAVAALAQNPSAPPPTPPAATPAPAPTAPAMPILSTSDKIALQALEKQKQEAQQQFQQSLQSESVIEREFTTAHPGYHVNPQTFIVEADGAPGSAPEPHNSNFHRPTAKPTTPPAK